MKARLFALSVAPLLSVTAFASTYTGPSSPVVATVAAANKAADDTPVVLQGFLISKQSNELYKFQDTSGTIMVEIDNEDLPTTTFNETTKVKLTGEVENKLLSREIDVDLIEFIN